MQHPKQMLCVLKGFIITRLLYRHRIIRPALTASSYSGYLGMVRGPDAQHERLAHCCTNTCYCISEKKRWNCTPWTQDSPDASQVGIAVHVPSAWQVTVALPPAAIVNPWLHWNVTCSVAAYDPLPPPVASAPLVGVVGGWQFWAAKNIIKSQTAD